MCSAHKHHRVCTIGLCETRRCVLVHLVVGDFGWVSLLRHCWEGLVIDRLPVVGYWLGSGADYYGPHLVDYWGLAGWDDFVVKILVPVEQVEWGRGIEPLALVVHNKFG